MYGSCSSNWWLSACLGTNCVDAQPSPSHGWNLTLTWFTGYTPTTDQTIGYVSVYTNGVYQTNYALVAPACWSQVSYAFYNDGGDTNCKVKACIYSKSGYV